MVFDYFESSLGLKNEGILKNIKDRIFSHGVGFSTEKSKQPKAAASALGEKNQRDLGTLTAKTNSGLRYR